MGIVFDEIQSDVIPSTEKTDSDSGPADAEPADGLRRQADLQRSLERIRVRQLRLMAD